MSKIINAFPGYEYVIGPDKKAHNMYRGTDVGFGGYVYAQPGMYSNVALLDVGNMHGASILALNKFGENTQRYKEIREARMAIKARDYDRASKMLNGVLAPYLTSDEEADRLANALKLVLNSTYGIAAATFANELRDPRDKNNIIALRGALFMRTLQDEVAQRGFKVAHIKTDSIKIPNATQEIIDFCFDFGRKYGYEFEHECTYERMCLVNNAVYIAKYDEQGIRNKGGKHANEWTATGAQFAVPYIFKTLFSHEEIEFKDLCETKSTTDASMYLDMNESLEDVSALEKEYKKRLKAGDSSDELAGILNQIAAGHRYHFVGKVGMFTPVVPGAGGGVLLSSKDQVKYDAVTGTKGFRWLESEMVKDKDLQDKIDMEYFNGLCNDAIKNIEKYGAHDIFIEADHDTYASYARSLLDPEFNQYMQSPVEVIDEGEEIPFR